jgi:hypothetical protein
VPSLRQPSNPSWMMPAPSSPPNPKCVFVQLITLTTDRCGMSCVLALFQLGNKNVFLLTPLLHRQEGARLWRRKPITSPSATAACLFPPFAFSTGSELDDPDGLTKKKKNPHSRVCRIARGSGCAVADVNELLAQYRVFSQRTGKPRRGCPAPPKVASRSSQLSCC